jgi:hypothetical protein
MRRRLLMLLVLALAATACDYREVLRIDADGSAELRIEFDVPRADNPEGIPPFLVPWEAAEGMQAELLAAEDDSVARTFIVELFALEGTEAWIDDAVEGLTFEVDDTGQRLGLDWDIDDVSTAPADDSIFEGSLLLSGATVDERDGGSMSLVAPTRDAAANWVTEYFALENDPFIDLDRVDAGASPLSISVQIEVPGQALRSDAHATDGRTHSWTWEFDRAGAPGVQIEWDPRPDDDGCELCGAFMPFLILIAVLFGILALGVLAATLGLFEAVRVTRRDRRDIS